MQIKESTLQEIYDWGFGVAAKVIEQGKEVQPVLLVAQVKEDHLAEPQIVGFQDFAEHKDAYAYIIKQIVKRTGSDVACLILETWFAHVAREEYEAEGMEMRPPSERPERREGVFFLFYTHEYTASAMCPITRDPNGLERSDIKYAGLKGRFVPDDDKGGTVQ